MCLVDPPFLPNTLHAQRENAELPIMNSECLICMRSVSEPDGFQCRLCEARTCSKRHLAVHQGANAFSNEATEANDDRLCLPFKVACDKSRGRHFIATRDIKPLEVVLRDAPSVIGPATKSKPVCLECLKVLTKGEVYLCPGCAFPICSKQCSKSGVLHHEKECVDLRSFPGASRLPFDQESPIYAAIFILRFWRLQLLDPDEHSEATFLMTGDTSDSDFRSAARDITRIIQEYFGKTGFGLADALRYMGIKRTNANNMANMKGRVGNILYPVYPLINSHCYCNTRYKIDPSTYTIEVRAQRPIKVGEEITTRYVSPVECQPRRQAKIWRNWSFLCQCRRCLDPTELDTHFSAVKCLHCGDYMLPMISTMLGSPWKCAACGKKCGQNDIEKRLHALEEALRAHSGADDAELQALLESQLHQNHLFLYCRAEAKLLHRYKADIDTEAGLRRRIALARKLLEVLEKIDPGLTARRGSLLKCTAKDKLCLAKLLADKAQGRTNDGKTCESDQLFADVKNDLKIAALCLKYS